jgi:plasmid maintenance system antidote protein VapI
LAKYFGGDAQSWLNLQTAYDLKVVEQQFGDKINTEVLSFEQAAFG